MPLNYDYLISRRFEPATHTYTHKDTILYALGIGADELQYTYEKNLRAIPTMAAVLGPEDGWIQEPEARITFHKILHGEQRLTIHRPLPRQGTIRVISPIDAIYDKGPGKGALILLTRHISDALTGEPLADVGMTLVLRADGGFGGSSEGAPVPHPLPDDRPPDLALDLPTRPDQALIYRLSGDYNPLHVDPDVAKAAGFERPILQGLCAYGVVCRAMLRLLCGNDPSRLRRLNVRFTSPLYSGESIRTEVWRQEPGRAVFRALAAERGVVIQNNGVVEVAD
jgi:acyl dehydratase